MSCRSRHVDEASDVIKQPSLRICGVLTMRQIRFHRENCPISVVGINTARWLWGSFPPSVLCFLMTVVLTPPRPSQPPPSGLCRCMLMLESPPLASQTAPRSLACTSAHREPQRKRGGEKPHVRTHPLLDMMGWITLVFSEHVNTQQAFTSSYKQDLESVAQTSLQETSQYFCITTNLIDYRHY